MPQVPLITIDVGNSRVKVGLFDESPSQSTLVRPARVVRWSHDAQPTWPEITPDRILLGTVQPSSSLDLIASMPSTWPQPQTISNDQFQLSFHVDQPSAVGVDRIANAAAAAVLRPNADTVIVDAGTAITIDLVDGDRCFHGGAILPGLQMAADALTARTDLLPRIDMKDRRGATVPGRNTVDAIAAGVFESTAGGIASLARQLLQSSDSNPETLFCGGSGARLAARLENSDYHETLTLAGIALAGLHE